MHLNPLHWQPAIYEHKATLIGHTPMNVACNADLFVEALLKEYEVYQADYLTVGLDVYNVEAEALGAKLTVPGPYACPDLAGQLFSLGNLPAELTLPAIPGAGRFEMLLDVASAVHTKLSDRVSLRVAASGPITLAAKLVGMEDLVLSLCMENGNADRLLAFTTEITKRWLLCLRQHGCDAVIFDSMAAPPMFSPDLFKRVVLPLHQTLMTELADSGQVERELVIGGNTTPIAALLKQTGATILLCDCAADAADFSTALGDDTQLWVRRNVSPAALVSRDHVSLAGEFARELGRFSNPIAGTGILPYDFPPEVLHSFRQAVCEQSALVTLMR
jgi:uroporphyrinogen decarboxylase